MLPSNVGRAMSQHTPGPNWECLGKDGDAWVICAKDAKDKRRTIAHVYQEPNARLIAKALEMYLTILDEHPHRERVPSCSTCALLREIERQGK